jgi:hypothetical protein
MCNCKALPELFADPIYDIEDEALVSYAKQYPQFFNDNYELYVKDLEFIPCKRNTACKSTFGSAFYTCRECGQAWKIDTAPEEGQPVIFAAKVTAEDISPNFDDNHLREYLVVLAYGGLSNQNCKEQDCNNYALKGVKECQQHRWFP